MSIRSIRVVRDVSDRRHLVQDVLLPGAVLPVSISYHNLRVPGLVCARCGGVMIVHEQAFRSVSPSAFVMRRVDCANWFVSGCPYSVAWSDSIRASLDAQAVELASAPAEF